MKKNFTLRSVARCFACLLLSFIINTTSSKAQWVNGIGGSNAEYGQGIATDAAGNVYVIGDFRGKADFDPGPGTFYLTSSCPCDESDPLKPDIFFAKYTKEGALIWARKVGGGGNDFGKNIGIDRKGNVYITGYFEGTADFDPSAGVHNLIGAGGQDIFLAKYDLNGALIWANGIGGAFFEGAGVLSVTPSGIIILGGSFGGSVDFDPSPNTTILDAGGSSDPFFARYDTNGNLVWVKDIAGTGESSAQSVFVDATGSIYLSGVFFGTSDFDPGTGVFNLTGVSAKDAFFAKYNAAGNLVWAGSVGGSGDQTAQKIVADNAGNIYVTGFYTGTVDFDPGAGVFNLSSIGNWNAYVLKITRQGKFAWVNNIGGSLDDVGLSVATDLQGRVYATGYFSNTAVFDATTSLTSRGSTDIYIATYDAAGKLLLAQQAGGTSDDWASDVVTDNAGFAYITGYFTGTSIFPLDKTNTPAELTSAGLADVYLLKLKTVAATYCASGAANSSQEWIDLVFLSDMFNNTGNDGGYHDYTAKVATIAAGAVYDVSLSAGFNGGPFTEAWRVWIDWNKDGDFEDSNELVVQYKSSSGSSEAHPFVIEPAASGFTRMRVAMKRNNYSNPCDTFGRGEVEDYTINVLPLSGVVAATSVNESRQLPSALTVSPNPAKDYIMVNAPALTGKLLLQVYDMSGKMVVSKEAENVSPVKLAVDHLQKGFYILRIRDAKGKINTIKWIKE